MAALVAVVDGDGTGEHLRPAIELGFSSDELAQLLVMDPIEVLKRYPALREHLFDILEFSIDPYEGGGEELL